MTKKEIRSIYLKHRLELSASDLTLLNKNLSDQFFSLLGVSVKVVHIFLSIVSKNEPDTWPIIEKLTKNFPWIRISLPRVENDRLLNFYYSDEKVLEKNKWGILEPTSGEPTQTESIDLVIVPLLAFDKTGNRVGYGRGFYDRFLKECRPDCKKVGLSFFDASKETFHVEPFDVKLTHCITPDKIYQF